MSTTVENYTPNAIQANPTSPATSSWRYVGIDPTTRALTFHATLAAVKAAGKLTYPGLGAGKIKVCLIGTKTAAGLVGSEVLFRVNSAAIPTGMATATNAVAGAGQQISIPCPFRNLAVSLAVTSDLLVLEGAY